MNTIRRLLLLVLPCLSQAMPIPLPKGVLSDVQECRERTANEPFATELTFTFTCDHSITPLQKSFDPALVAEGDSIWVDSCYLPWFSKSIHPLISHHYILVTDAIEQWQPIHSTYKMLYDPKLSAWFSKNLLLNNHPKLFQLPVGQNALFWNTFTQKAATKTHLILLDRAIGDSGVSEAIYDAFRGQSYCFFVEEPTPRMNYWTELAKAKFLFCPSSNGLDSPYFWEAIALGVIPVVQHSPLDSLYAGLPVLYVDEWEDVNETFLRQKYNEIQAFITRGLYSVEKASFAYWASKIHEVQRQVREGFWEASHLESTQWSADFLEGFNEILNSNSSINPSCLLITGHCVGLRALQLVDRFRCFERIILTDPYLLESRQNHLAQLKEFVGDIDLYHGLSRLRCVDKTTALEILSKNRERRKATYALFDLTHYQSDLTDELDLIYDQLSNDMILCGNMASDPTVRTTLAHFCQARNTTLKVKGDLWWFFCYHSDPCY